MEALINGIIPKENGLSKVFPPPPEYILIICIIAFLVSDSKKVFFNAS
jgi:hypothetical protein